MHHPEHNQGEGEEVCSGANAFCKCLFAACGRDTEIDQMMGRRTPGRQGAESPPYHDSLAVFGVASLRSRRIHSTSHPRMAFNLKKVLKALLLSSSQPLAIKDIQAAFTRFHEQASALPMGDTSAGEGESAAPGPSGENTARTSTERASLGAAAAEPSAASTEEVVEVIADSSAQDPELYFDVPSLITATQIREVMDQIAADLRASDDGLLLIEGNAGYRLVTHPRFARWVRILRQEPPPVKLSQSSIETLAVIAYRQPVTRGEIETIRGVSAEAGINKLLEREMVYIVGRADAPGRPIQYGTTDQFLEFVGIKSLDELPASDVLSSRQIDEWLKNSAHPHTPTDTDMGLADEQLPLESATGSPLRKATTRPTCLHRRRKTQTAAKRVPKPDMDLGPIREKIDSIDKQLVELLNQRLALAAEIGKVKRSAGGQIYVAEREDAVLRKVTSQNQGPIKNEALRAIYREIMSAAIALEKPLLVAYLGPEASNTHAAALKKFGASVEYHAMATVSDIFTAVEKGETDYAVIPIENSTEGSVREALDSFVESDLKDRRTDLSGNQSRADLRTRSSKKLSASTRRIRRSRSVGIGCSVICHTRSWSMRRARHAPFSLRKQEPARQRSQANWPRNITACRSSNETFRTKLTTRRAFS